MKAKVDEKDMLFSVRKVRGRVRAGRAFQGSGLKAKVDETDMCAT